MPKRILTVVGTRPNFIKITQFAHQFGKFPELFEHRLLHTGQHYDRNMSQIFFEQLKLSEPDYYLGIEAGHPADQMGRIMCQLTPILESYKPDLIMVVGDVNSTFAAALTANKFGIKIAHVESGLRSKYLDMPEEINRILTDRITDIFLITEPDGRANLLAENYPESKMFDVGNTMIDTLVAFDEEIQKSDILHQLKVTPETFALMTIHRPRNVDRKEQLLKLIQLIEFTGERTPVVFPVHPRTKNKLNQFDLWEKFKAIPNLVHTGPLDYLAFQNLISNCKFMITDSGGIQEETTFRQKPCLTLRPSTERPVTITTGSNELISFDLDKLQERIDAIENGQFKKGEIPDLWDGNATERIVEVMKNYFYE